MVTTEEAKLQIEQRRSELSTIERQLQEIQEERIPQRKLGSRVTPQLQRSIVERRQQAQTGVQQVRQEREKLRSVEQQIREVQAAEELASQSESRRQQFEFGRRLALEGRFAGKLTQAEREGFEAGSEALSRSQALRERAQSQRESAEAQKQQLDAQIKAGLIGSAVGPSGEPGFITKENQVIIPVASAVGGGVLLAPVQQVEVKEIRPVTPITFKGIDDKLVLSPTETVREINRITNEARLFFTRPGTRTGEFLRTRQEKAIAKLESIRRTVPTPTEKIEFKQQDLQRQINAQVDAFNKRFGGRTLSDSEFMTARLAEAELFNSTEIKAAEIKRLEEIKPEVRGRTLPESIVIAGFRAPREIPASTTALTTGLLLDPKKTLKDIFKGFREQPLESISASITTGSFVKITSIARTKLVTPRLISKEPVPKRIITSTDILQPLIIEGRELGKFKLTIVSPERTGKFISPLDQLLGKEPKIRIIAPERTDIVITPKPLLIEKGAIISEDASVLLKREGATLTKLSRLSAGGEKINIRKFENELIDIEKFMAKEGLSKRVKEIKIETPFIDKGLSIKEVAVIPGALKQDFFRGTVTARKAIKGSIRRSPREINIFIPKPGKTVTSAMTLSQIAEITDIKLEGFELFRTRTAVKQLSEAIEKASGKVETIEGVTFLVEEPMIVGTDLSQNIIKMGGDIRQATKQMSRENIAKAIAAIEGAKGVSVKQVPIPRIRTAKETADFRKRLKQTVSPSSAVAAFSKALSDIGSTRGFLITEENIGPLSLELRISPSIREIPRSVSANISREISLSSSASIQKESQRELQRELQRSLQKELQKELQKSLQKELQKQVQRQVPRQLQKQLQKQIQKDILKFPGPPIRPPTKIPPQKPIIIPNLKFKERQDRDFQKQAFLVQSKIRGQFKTIAKGLPKGKALLFGREFTRKELAATFRLIPAGKTFEQDITAVIDPKEFRSFAIESGKRIDIPGIAFIQKAGTRAEGPTIPGGRLRSREERAAIQVARVARIKLT